MAKAIGSANKVSFGKRKTGRAKKSFNKHSPKPNDYKGQVR